MKTFVVDAFTHEPFKGNPAGVCVVENTLADETMLNIAQELKHSETAFIQASDTAGTYSIRYFSPKMEIPLCGHATLGAAKVVLETEHRTDVRFINIQNIHLTAHESDGQIVMQFPVYGTHKADAPSALLDALGICRVNNVVYNDETKILMLEISDATELAALQPDFQALHSSHDEINGVLVTAASSDKTYDFHSRYFWPWSGTNEDPVTGGTHTFLAKYWAQKLGKNKLRSFQASKRTGAMEVEIIGDQLLIKSQAVMVLRGEIQW